MGLFDRLKAGLRRTQTVLSDNIRRIWTGSPKATPELLEELEMSFIAADFGYAVTERIVAAIKRGYESAGSEAPDIFTIAKNEVVQSLSNGDRSLKTPPEGPCVITMVGVNGTGKTTTTAKLAARFRGEGQTVVLAACDTFRAAAIEQLKIWGDRLEVPVVSGSYGADPAAVAHDALSMAEARQMNFVLVDTAGRLHTKHNLMKELEKVHRVLDRKCAGSPHEVLLVLDATTGMNALTQAREFNKAVPLTGLVVTKLDGTSKGGMVVAIQHELGIPVKFIGVGEQPDDLQPFDPVTFAEALFQGAEVES